MGPEAFPSHRPGVGNVVDGRRGTGAALTTTCGHYVKLRYSEKAPKGQRRRGEPVWHTLVNRLMTYGRICMS